MQEERAASWGYTPVNATPFVGATRDVFNDQVVLSENVFEPMPVRLKQREPSNEVMCMPKDDVGRTCPQLLPPEPVQQPNWGTCSGFPPPPGAGDPLVGGDGYLGNFGVGPPDTLYFPQPVLPAPKPLGRWFFPADPTPQGLVRRPGQAPRVVVGPPKLRLTLKRADGGAIRGVLLGAGPKKEMVKHGRLAPGESWKNAPLQMSVAVNIPPGGSDQLRRANEAGGGWNGREDTASRLVDVWTGQKKRTTRCADPFVQEVFTKTQAAWWRRPGAIINGARVLNNTVLSPYAVHKRVSAGPGGFTYRGGVHIPPQEQPRNVRIATRFSLSREYNRVLAFHYPSQRWVALPQSRTLRVGLYRALVVSNRSGTHALGVTLRNFPKPPIGSRLHPSAYYAVNVTNRAPGTLVSLVHQVGVRGGNVPLPARTWTYLMTFKVGTLRNVTRRLANLAINLPDADQAMEAGGKAPVCRPGKRQWKWRPEMQGTCFAMDADWVPGRPPGAVPMPGVVAPPRPMRGCAVTTLEACINNRCSVRDRRRVCKGCQVCHNLPQVAAKRRTCTVPALRRCVKNRCVPGDRRPGCVACTACGFTSLPVRKCAVRREARCVQARCGLRDKRAVCRGCTMCRDLPPGNKVCTTGLLQRCARLACGKGDKRPGCRGCAGCGFAVGKPPPAKKPLKKPLRGMRRECEVKDLALCRRIGCKPNSKSPACKGCLRCWWTKVPPKVGPKWGPFANAPGGKKCRVRKLARCAGCGPKSKSPACRGCVQCVPRKKLKKRYGDWELEVLDPKEVRVAKPKTPMVGAMNLI